MGPRACWALHPWLPKVSGMFPTLLPAVLALFVVRGCGSRLYQVTLEAGDALLWEGTGLLLPPGRAREEARTCAVQCW